MNKITVVVGTRPEIIKMAPVIKALEKKCANYFILHTGQHYSHNLDTVFFHQLELPQPKYNLKVGSGSHANQTAKILMGVEKILLQENSNVVLVQGDTNSVLGAALAAVKLHIKVGHVEAGLRSYDMRMPEEINRILTDHCANYLFPPTEGTKIILLEEGIPKEKIFVTGNTIVDAVCQNLAIAKKQTDALDVLNLSPGKYFLVTLHRQENVDDIFIFSTILRALEELVDEFCLPAIYPIHPRSKKTMDEFGLIPKNVRLIEPLDFFSFLQMESQAKLVLTDSGGVQEECCIMNVPCVTLRNNTERPETIEVGSNMLAGTAEDRILDSVRLMINKKNNWANPFGDGKAGEKIVDIILTNLGH